MRYDYILTLALKNRKLSKLAKILKIDYSYLHNILKGKKKPSKKVTRLLRMFEIEGDNGTKNFE